MKTLKIYKPLLHYFLCPNACKITLFSFKIIRNFSCNTLLFNVKEHFNRSQYKRNVQTRIKQKINENFEAAYGEL